MDQQVHRGHLTGHDSPSVVFGIEYLAANSEFWAGNLDTAESILERSMRACPSPAALDLLARIKVQKGRYREAQGLWQQVVEIEPDNEPAKAALARLATPWVAVAAAKGYALLAGLLVLVVFALIGLNWVIKPLSGIAPQSIATKESIVAENTAQSNSVAKTSEPLPAIEVPNGRYPIITVTNISSPEYASALEQAHDSLESLQAMYREQTAALNKALEAVAANQTVLMAKQTASAEHVVTLEKALTRSTAQEQEARRVLESTRNEVDQLTQAVASLAKALTNPPIVLKKPAVFSPTVKGVTVIPKTNGWVICFDSGLFDRDCHFKPGSKDLVNSVAKALAMAQEKITIEVVGFASQEPATWPWSKAKSDGELALDRAIRVNRHIQSLGIFPPNAITASAGEVEHFPLPSRSNNTRTVTLRVLTTNFPGDPLAL